METKDNKMLRNVTTRWISMMSPVMRVLNEYKTVIVKMGLDMTPSGKKQKQKVTAIVVDNFNSRLLLILNHVALFVSHSTLAVLCICPHEILTKL